MENDKIPGFVQGGAFNWLSKGYYYNLSKEELLKVELENNENPWYAIASVVELAKRGDFSQSGFLSKFFDVGLITNVAPSAILITGDIGRDKDLEKLIEIMQKGPDGFRVYACRAAANSGCMWLVPHMLDAWHLVDGVDAHENIGYAIADLLDPIEHLDDMGPIASRAGMFSYDIGRYRPNSKLEKLAGRVRDQDASSMFHEVVMRCYTDLIKVYTSNQFIFWAGEARSVYGFAELFLNLITSDKFNMTLAPLVVSLRHKFEAATGINCSIFFKNGRFSQLEAVCVLEEFLSRDKMKAVHEGERYFFGHLISK